MSYDGPTPTKFGQYGVAEPLHAETMHLYAGEKLTTVDHEPPLPVLDQEDLFAQGIDTSQVVKGAASVDALGSCTAQATTVSLAERWKAAGRSLSAIALTDGSAGWQLGSDAISAEKFAIAFYSICTHQTGDPAQEWPPTDCGSTGLYCCSELEKQKLIGSWKTATGIHAVASLLQAGSVIMGGPWFNNWMSPDENGFVDGDGSVTHLSGDILSGVAGGHETCITAIEQLKFNAVGLIDPDASTLRVRNSWSTSFADNGSYRIHLSTLQLLGRYFDFKQFVIAA